MKKVLRVFEFVIFPSAVFILLVSGLIIYFSTGGSKSSSYEKDYSLDAATVDAACKDYYAICVAGVAPGEGTTKSEKEAFTAKASIKDALEYANIHDYSLENMSVDKVGTIYATDESSSSGRSHEEDWNKTMLLRNNRWEEEGSLQSLYKASKLY